MAQNNQASMSEDRGETRRSWKGRVGPPRTSSQVIRASLLLRTPLAAAVLASFLAVTAASWVTAARAADRIRLAAQTTGTLAWELDIIRSHGLDKQAGLDLQVVELASTEAGKIALRSGSVDMIVSDWLWVARERSLGDHLVFYPYSSTLGAVMTPSNSAIADLADLKGKKLAVAGGPLDKSWLLLQAVARRGGFDLNREANIVYGAPPLLSAKAMQREHDATLTFWNFCAELEGRGFKRAIDMEAIEKRLGAEGPVAMVGYAFDAAWAAKNQSAVARFLDVAAKAKDILAGSEAEWQRLAPRIGVTDKVGLAIYRQRYSEGIPRRPIAQEASDARALYRVLAGIGGTDLVGPASDLDKGTFYDPGKID
jgi:NitT/TauT family transport system substrate-binding protein